MVNGTIPWPQQQPQQQLISYDSDGGWVRGGLNGDAGVPPPSGNGGDGGNNSGTSVVMALAMSLEVGTAAVVTATAVIVGSILVVATTATPLLPGVVVHRRIE